MRNYFKISIFFFLLVFLFQACKKEDSNELVDIPKLNYEYFPIELGRYVEYDVIDITIDAAVAKKDTLKYQIKEIIDTIYNDLEGRRTQKIIRYKRSNSKNNWLVKDVWTSNRTVTTAERLEENERFVKLIFPPIIDKVWNGNNYNTQKSWDYKCTSLDKSETVGILKFDSILTVKQSGLNSLVTVEIGYEKYAKKVGMVYKELQIRNNLLNPTIETSTILKMTATAFGKESR